MKPSYKIALWLFMSNLVFMQLAISTKLQFFPVGLTETVFYLFRNIYLQSEGGF